jgi:hypothetical protein
MRRQAPSPEIALFAAELSVLDVFAEIPMHPILLSPLVKWSLAALGGAMVIHWAVKEARRINEELDQAIRVKARITDQENRPTLRRDPRTGEYRL